MATNVLYAMQSINILGHCDVARATLPAANKANTITVNSTQLIPAKQVAPVVTVSSTKLKA